MLFVNQLISPNDIEYLSMLFLTSLFVCQRLQYSTGFLFIPLQWLCLSACAALALSATLVPSALSVCAALCRRRRCSSNSGNAATVTSQQHYDVIVAMTSFPFRPGHLLCLIVTVTSLAAILAAQFWIIQFFPCIQLPLMPYCAKHNTTLKVSKKLKS